VHEYLWKKHKSEWEEGFSFYLKLTPTPNVAVGYSAKV